MRIYQILSALGSVVSFISIILPWMSINLMIFGSLQPSLYDLAKANRSLLLGSSFQNDMYLCLAMVVVTVILGLIGIFKRVIAAAAVGAIAFSVVIFFLGLNAMRDAIPQTYGSIITTVNMGPFLLIVVGILFIGAIFIKDNQLAVVKPVKPAEPSVIVQKAEVLPPSEAEYVFCVNCGTKNPADATFCFNCGKPICRNKSQ